MRSLAALLRTSVLLLGLNTLSSSKLTGQTDAAAFPVPAPGQRVDLGGWRLHLHCTGAARASQPTVILEAGAGDFSVEWSLVQPRVAQFARVCSYDRAGSGWSDLGPRPRTMRQITYELHALLEKAGVTPPFVLVGHSYGGLLVRNYTAAYPQEVSGLILVDGGSESGVSFINGQLVRLADLATGRPIPPVKTSGPLRESDIPEAALIQIAAAAAAAATHANEPPRDRLSADAQLMRTWALGQIKHYAANDNPFDREELAALIAQRQSNAQPLDDRPLVVLTSGLPAHRPDAQELEEERKRLQAAHVKLSRCSKQVIAPRSDHHIQLDDPDLVVRAIRDVVSALEAEPSGQTPAYRRFCAAAARPDLLLLLNFRPIQTRRWAAPPPPGHPK